MGDSLLFLNVPVSSEDKDIIGIGSSVKKLNAAIDAGAQVIGVTSPFGAGKSSLIKMLEQKRSGEQDRSSRKERFLKVYMWPHLGQGAEDPKDEDGVKRISNAKSADDAAINLHKMFVYQLASQLDVRKGTYISRRLSRNYGLLRLHTNKPIYSALTLIGLILVLVFLVMKSYSEFVVQIFPAINSRQAIITTGALIAAAILGVIILTRADIIFSSNQSEGGRTIETDEIIDLYHNEILMPRAIRGRCWRKRFRGEHYIVVIEDLDRTEEPRIVLNFLKELRKYCVSVVDSEEKYLNRVTFIVNIKPEPLLLGEQVGESLYAKLFDFVLNLQTVNIDNYDAILNGLLREHVEGLKELGLLDERESNFTKIPGMQWIIRERRIGIREIKERLNIAFSIYGAIFEKFPQSSAANGAPIAVSFEKCAAVAYLTTAFQEDFYRTDDRAFQTLVDLYLKDPSAEELPAIIKDGGGSLQKTSPEYRKAVWELVRAKLIDSTYRTYFYNYPKGSHLYNTDEWKVVNALLYGEVSDDFEEAAKRVGAPVIINSYDKLRQLGLTLPMLVFQVQTLYVVALEHCFKDVIKRLDTLDYSAAAAGRNLQFFSSVLSFDPERKVYSQSQAAEFCTLWERRFLESDLIQLRKELCESYPQEIEWYQALFFGVHPIITFEEFSGLSFPSAVRLINLESKDFSVEGVRYVVEYFRDETNWSEDFISQAEDFLHRSMEALEIGKLAPLLLEFMTLIGRIIPDFESAVYPFIKEEFPAPPENGLLHTYQSLVNRAASQGLTPQTAKYVSSLDYYDNYTLEVAEQLRKHNYDIDFTLLSLVQGRDGIYGDRDIMDAVREWLGWLVKDHLELFFLLRSTLIRESPPILEQYTFLFGDDCPVMTQEELTLLQNSRTYDDFFILKLLPPKLITQEQIPMLSEHFCRRKQPNALTFETLSFVAALDDAVTEELFYSLDFDMVRYRYIARANREAIKAALQSALHLDAADGKIGFMGATKWIDSDWEADILPELKDNDELQEKYVDAVNRCDKIPTSTIRVLCALPTIPVMSDTVNEALFRAKQYKIYISSKTRGAKYFEMEAGERGETLWSTYVDIFQTPSNEYQKTKGYMAQNAAFLKRFMEEARYEGMEEEGRMTLARVPQDAASLKNVMEYGDDFALRYYQGIDGFKDWDAASAFVDIVLSNDTLLASNALYNYAHPKLLDGTLKYRYTVRRKNAGYML